MSIDDEQADVDVVMNATRAFVAVAAKSLVPVEGVVTLMQWRVLVVTAAAEQLSLNEVAAAVGVHPSTATRLCDRLVAAGFLSRKADPDDRRYIALSLTRKGQRLVEKVTASRRRDIKEILERFEPARRRRIARALGEFAAAVGETTPDLLLDLRSEAGIIR